MKRKQFIAGISAALGMLILILDGKTAIAGAQMGIELCLKTVIPSLFPFFVLSILLTSSFSGTSAAFLISGFLGGYPVGAQCVAQAYRSGQMRKEDAERMLSFCNNAGPAFLFGMVSSMFPEAWMAWALWGIHVVSALLSAKIFVGNPGTVRISGQSERSLSNILHSALRVMAAVCGWVVLFRVIIAFLNRWMLWLLPLDAQIALIGFLELSNGCCELLRISNVNTRFLICSGMLAFGGLCVTMQTVSVTNGLSLRYYIAGKLLQSLFSLLLSVAVLYGGWQAACVIAAILFLIPNKTQKKGSIQAAVGV